MDEVRIAKALATLVHDGQFRRHLRDIPGAEPEEYIEHPRRVAEAVLRGTKDMLPIGMPDKLVAAAWLHDTVEDTPLKLEDLPRFEFSRTVQMLVKVLTKLPDEHYGAYIQRVSKSGWAAKFIKICDLRDNMRDLPEDHSLRTRYEGALTTLET